MAAETKREHSSSFRREARPLALSWLALLALMAATLFLSTVPLGAGNAIGGIAIAAVKTAIVVWWFMHLRHAHALVRTTAAVALFMLALLATLSGIDYATRLDEPARVQAPQQIAPIVRYDRSAHDNPR